MTYDIRYYDIIDMIDAGHCERAQAPIANESSGRRQAREHRLNLSANQVGHGGRSAAVGNVQELDACGGIEHLTEQVID